MAKYCSSKNLSVNGPCTIFNTNKLSNNESLSVCFQLGHDIAQQGLQIHIVLITKPQVLIRTSKYEDPMIKSLHAVNIWTLANLMILGKHPNF